MTSKTRKRKQQADDSEMTDDADIGKTSCKRTVSEVCERKVDETLEKLRNMETHLHNAISYGVK